jgi:sugar/nucleoside kinase (ribokinase family)
VRLPLSLPPRTGRAFDAVGFGLNSIDFLTVVAEHPRPNSKQRIQRFARLPGGQAATAMVTCARLGWRARYIGRFGDDDLGNLGRQSLIEDGVDVSAASTARGATNGFAVILVDARSGDRTIMWDRHPGLAMTRADVPAEAVRSARVLLVDCHETDAATQAAETARAAGIPTVIDVERVRPGIGELLEQIDVIIAAGEFPGALTGKPLGEALGVLARDFRAALVCATLGREGSVAVCQGREIRTPAFHVPVIDTTGAGDVFRGGFIAAWLLHEGSGEVEELLAYANAVAALKCRMLGARAGIPGPDEVAALLRAPRGL